MSSKVLARIILAGLSGTTMMTLFSYLISKKNNEQLKEPVLLSALLGKGSTLNITKRSTLDGWILHYAVGFFFAGIYDQLWTKKNSKPSIASGLLLGGINGVVAIGIWKTAFEIHPNPPQINPVKYYPHLFLAHLVFGSFTALGYKISEVSENDIDNLKSKFVQLIKRENAKKRKRSLLVPPLSFNEVG